MRINKYVAQATGMSRRAADTAITARRVLVNGEVPEPGYDVRETDQVTLDSDVITPDVNIQTIMLNKPVGYVCSRDGQGSKTIYDLLPAELHHLKPVGRLDKASTGLILLTNDGQLAHQLTHPTYRKTKIYEITLDKPLTPLHRQMITDHGVQLDDGPSSFTLERLNDDDLSWQVSMQEGRNRQIRRTFAALGYSVVLLHRIHFGSYQLGQLATGTIREIT